MIDIDVIEEIFNKTKKEYKEMEKVNILVVGKTGVGKSTLINSVFREELAETGVGKPVTQHLKKITKEGKNLKEKKFLTRKKLHSTAKG